jgi:RNA polymerase sigma-70 factor (ECF subfamily)
MVSRVVNKAAVASDANDIESVSSSRPRQTRDSGVFCIASAVDANSSDEALVDGMLRDRADAWREFQRRFDRLIHRCITKVTRRFSTLVMHEDVREIYAILLLSLLSNDKHKLRTFDPERGNRFSSWIGLLAINASYDYLRGLKREPCKGTMAEAADLVCELPDPFELTAEHQRAQIAARALASFSERDREFASLYFGEGMDPSEIARSLNISVKTVYSKKHKIQSRLESALAPAGADESGVVAVVRNADSVIAA